MTVAVIILGIIIVLQIIERDLFARRTAKERVQEAMTAAQERSELAARVQGIPILPRPSETPSEELVEEPDETGMVGQVVLGDGNG